MKRFWMTCLLLAISTAILQLFLPWWVIIVFAAAMGWQAGLTPLLSFFAGFIAVFTSWLILGIYRDYENSHILATRMANLFHLPHYMLYLLVAALLGGLCSGLSALSASLIKRAFIN
jgi:hypothetical protein